MLLTCLLVVCGPADAQVADEVECEHAKVNTEDATPVDPGEWEVELAYGLTQADRAFGDHWSRTGRGLLREEEFGLGVTYGLVENLDVGFGVGYLDIYDRDDSALVGRGFTDLELGAKWRFYHDEARHLEIAYTPAVVLPTGRRADDDRIGITDDYASVFNGLALSKDWGDGWTSNFDLGFNWPVGEDRHDCRGTLGANAALGWQVTEWLQPEVELNYEHDFAHGDDADLISATAGAIVCVSDSVRLDLGVQRSLFGRNADYGTAVSAALVFGF
ncbi:MAG: transporter [Candidatus Brocadiia bacterium]